MARGVTAIIPAYCERLSDSLRTTVKGVLLLMQLNIGAAAAAAAVKWKDNSHQLPTLWQHQLQQQ